MKRETAEALVDRMLNLDIDAKMLDEYSGRGMYGNTTVALVIITEPLSMLAVGLAVGFAAAQLTEEGVDGLDFEDLPRRVDSMGRHIVLY